MDPRHAVTVLLVDDEDLVRMIGADILEEAGYRVIAVANAAEAIQQLERAGDVEILFTDVNMPGTPDGLGLATLVHSRWPNIRILVASGAVKPRPGELPDSGLFLKKPYDGAELLGLIRRLASQ